MAETEKDPVHTLTDEDIVSTPLTRRSLLAQTGLVLGLAGVAAIGAAQKPATAGDRKGPDRGPSPLCFCVPPQLGGGSTTSSGVARALVP